MIYGPNFVVHLVLTGGSLNDVEQSSRTICKGPQGGAQLSNFWGGGRS